MSEYTYVGQELDLFADAVNWKAYFHRVLSPYIHGDVLEAGAGIGATTRALCDGRQSSWVCLEPDPELAGRLRESLAEGAYPLTPEVVNSGVGELDRSRRFDAVLYIDVLEHIEDHENEVRMAREHLRQGGHLVVLAPAFQFLYSPFDKAVGHYRRYDKPMLKAVIPPGFERVRLRYLDSVGLLMSLVNRFALKQGQPKPEQIRFWDRVIVRASRCLDPLVFHSFGRSLVGVYKRISE